MKKVINLSAYSLMVAGASLIITNVILTPLIGDQQAFVDTVQSSIFIGRMSFAALTAALMLFGTVGLYLFQSASSNRLTDVSFPLAFLGSALLLANEWNQLFTIPALAKQNAEALIQLDSGGMSSYDIGAIAALLTFTFGWTLFSIAMLREGVFSRIGPTCILAGFVLTPVLTSFMHPILASAIGNSIIAFALIMLGRELIRRDKESDLVAKLIERQKHNQDV